MQFIKHKPSLKTYSQFDHDIDIGALIPFALSIDACPSWLPADATYITCYQIYLYQYPSAPTDRWDHTYTTRSPHYLRTVRQRISHFPNVLNNHHRSHTLSDINALAVYNAFIVSEQTCNVPLAFLRTCHTDYIRSPPGNHYYSCNLKNE